ncbi:hypothetical protein DTL42_20910 [Bremerella cremea]|uniref:Uncharacterized protein n=1 Tax=Bremerella cremea TaxID=1031537 RepID=A0A368KNG1_9BACT|nr:hypothetical protein [Bremerella cremea]RCS41050.1 hypothetical protein DTL42_20910 [Bremerella cremea]
MIADLLSDEGKSNSKPAPQVSDHPWRLAASIFWAVVFLAISLLAPQLPEVFPHVQLGWMLACFLMAVSAACMTTGNLPLRLLAAAVGSAFAMTLLNGLIQYNLIADEMAFRPYPVVGVDGGSILGAALISLVVTLHCGRIELLLREVPLGQREKKGMCLGLVQSGWLMLVIVALLFAGPMLATDLSGKSALSGENPWLLLAVGGSLLVAGAGSGLLVALLPTRSQKTALAHQ